MSLTKRGNTWHSDFFVDGVRYRQSLKTTDWREAQSEEKRLISAAADGKLATGRRKAIARMAFQDAAAQFIADRSTRLKSRTVKTEKHLAHAVNRVFGNHRVSSLSAVDLLDYVRARHDDGRAPATINKEVALIRGVLKRARRWHLFADEIKPLPVRQQIGRALSDDEKIRLLRIAAKRPAWQAAYYAAILALNTTARGCELKGLRWHDVDFLERTITIATSKTDAGERVIPLNHDAFEAIAALRRRAESIGGAHPENYVFFACERGHLDPTNPQKGWRTAWRSLTRAVTYPKCATLQPPAKTCSNAECGADTRNVRSSTAGLRFHDLRHHAITELAESQTSDSTIMSIAGHVSPKMLSHYSHIRLAAKRTALDAISTREAPSGDGHGQAGYATNTATNQQGASEGHA